MSSASFIVSFDGEKLQDGRINVRDLAPALLSIGNMIEAANQALGGDGQPVKVEATAVSVGSFEIALDVIVPLWDTMKSLLGDKDVQSAASLLQWLGIFSTAGTTGFMSLFWLLRQLKGSAIDKAERLPDGMIRINYKDGDLEQSLIVPTQIVHLYQERAVHEALGQLMDTLKSDTVDQIGFKPSHDAPAAPETTLTQEDAKIFRVPETQPRPVIENTQQMALSIRNLAFQEGNKWKLFDGQNVITAAIEDNEFISRVDRNVERFAKGDILICKVHSTQLETPSGLKTEYRVLRVLEHRPAQTQLTIPFENGQGSPE